MVQRIQAEIEKEAQQAAEDRNMFDCPICMFDCPTLPGFKQLSLFRLIYPRQLNDYCCKV